MRWQVILSVCVLVGGPFGCVSGGADGDDYVIVSLVPEGDAYYAAAKELARLRGGRIVAAEVDALDKLLDALRPAPPRFVAVVLRPEMLDENFARKFLVLTTKIDDDPFVDVAYGYITGDSAETAVSLAGAGRRAEQRRRRPDIAMVGVAGTALAESMSSTQQLPLRKGSLTQAMHLLSGGDAAEGNSGDDLEAARDDKFIREVMPKLAGHPILLFAGHGYPRQVVGGPTYRHLAGQHYDGAVAMNIACYTGVTGRWFDNDWRSMKVLGKKVPADESFCLNMLKTGVAGYVAYVSARPAGPAMLGDAMTLATAGESIGELMRDNANSVVLAHLQQGYDGLHVVELADGCRSSGSKVRDVLIAMSTGGVLFGDPAHVPFGRQPGAHPTQSKVKRNADSLIAQVETAGPLFHFFCSDQIAMWDEAKPSLRLEAKVPLGDRYATDVRLTGSTLGDVPHRLTAATEEHRGKRYLHVKASFAQPEMDRMMQFARDGVSGTFEVVTSGQPRDPAVLRRGDTD